METEEQQRDYLWARLAPALGDFKEAALACDLWSRAKESAPDPAPELHRRIADLALVLNEHVGVRAPACAGAKDRVGARMRGELLPYILLSESAARWYTKPRGYAGDYQAISWFYENRPRGVGHLGRDLDHGFLDLAAAHAVKNRRTLMAQQIRDTLDTTAPRPAKVTSLACGPATEVLDVLAELPDPAALDATLLDLDPEALAHIEKNLAALGQSHAARLLQQNLIHLALGRTTTDITDQDLVYSIGLIDYFPDRLVIALADLAHHMLRPGGRLVLGNFHPRNTTRALMDHVFDWRLIHRNEDDLDRLLESSAFGRPATRTLSEPLGINLFAQCDKD